MARCKFSAPKIKNVAGFPLESFGSFLVRERLEMNKARKEIFDNTHKILQVNLELSKALEVTEEESWAILTSEGFGPNGEDYRAVVSPFLSQLLNLQDTQLQTYSYNKAAVSLMLRSRLDPQFLVDSREDIYKAFKYELPLDALNNFATSPYSHRLESGKALIDELIDYLPEKVFDAIVDFAIEEEGTDSVDTEESSDPKSEGQKI